MITRPFASSFEYFEESEGTMALHGAHQVRKTSISTALPCRSASAIGGEWYHFFATSSGGFWPTSARAGAASARAARPSETRRLRMFCPFEETRERGRACNRHASAMGGGGRVAPLACPDDRPTPSDSANGLLPCAGGPALAASPAVEGVPRPASGRHRRRDR